MNLSSAYAMLLAQTYSTVAVVLWMETDRWPPRKLARNQEKESDMADFYRK